VSAGFINMADFGTRAVKRVRLAFSVTEDFRLVATLPNYQQLAINPWVKPYERQHLTRPYHGLPSQPGC
jgi:hypothetical protein